MDGMKYNGKMIAGALALALSIGLGASCGGGSSSSKRGPGTPKEIQIEPITIFLRDAASTLDVKVILISTTGVRTDITQDPTTTLTSSDPGVVTVTGAFTLTPQSAGAVVLDADYQGMTDTANVYSDFAPALAPGDFDISAPATTIRKGQTETLPVLVEMGSAIFGSYRVRLSYDPAHFNLVNVLGGPDLDKPLAIKSTANGWAEWTDTHSPSLGQSLTGSFEVVRLVLRAVGNPGDASIVTGDVHGIWTNDFPAVQVGSPTPRPFVTGRRWMVIE
ncbi:MAG: DUF3869 domain-containing protein [Planctomycetota bacterium]|nr:DUF3869 domain-containing protein [Planctomycetota bacterium]